MLVGLVLKLVHCHVNTV